MSCILVKSHPCLETESMLLRDPITRDPRFAKHRLWHDPHPPKKTRPDPPWKLLGYEPASNRSASFILSVPGTGFLHYLIISTINVVTFRQNVNISSGLFVHPHTDKMSTLVQGYLSPHAQTKCPYCVTQFSTKIEILR